MCPVNNKRDKSKLFFPLGQLLLDLKGFGFSTISVLISMEHLIPQWNFFYLFIFLRTKTPSDLDLDASVTADFTGCQLSIVHLIDEIIMMYHA